MENDLYLRRAALASERLDEAQLRRKYLRTLRLWLEDRQVLAEMLRQETGLEVRMSAPQELVEDPAPCR